MSNKKLRMTVDLSMTVLLPMLMAYSLIGETFHEVIGTLMLALFITHNYLNRAWYKALFKGRYDAGRVFQTVLNLSLLIFIILQPLSGIMMSKHLYTFINVPGSASFAREIHMVLAYWGFALMSLHAGTHLAAPLGKLRKTALSSWRMIAVILCAVSVYGCCTFFKRNISDYMFMRTAFAFFDYNEPRILFFMDYIAIMIMFAVAGCLIRSVMSRR